MTKLQSSKTTGPALPVNVEPNSTGRQRGATGSGGQSILTTPAENDRNLQASLPQSVTSALAEKVDRDFNLTGYTMMTPVPNADRDLAISLLRRSLGPLPRNTIEKELARLSSMTRSRNLKQDDLKLMVAAYADELEKYPEDIVVYVLRAWADTNIWFPAWADLAVELRWRTDKRQFKLDALSKEPDQIAGRIAGLIENALRKD